MKKWLKRVRGAVLMGITWAVVWAPIAILIGMLVDPDNSMDEMWVMIGALPGFLSGVIFSILLSVAARRRRFEELSLPRFTAWGAAAGLLMGVFPFMVGTANPAAPAWLPLVVIGSITALGAASAAGTLALARKGETRELPAGDPVAKELPPV
jgi:hypothetical protein